MTESVALESAPVGSSCPGSTPEPPHPGDPTVAAELPADEKQLSSESPRNHSRVGEGFRLIAYLLPELPEAVVRELHDVLGARLALPTPSERRRERLALLLDYLHAHRRPPTAAEYDEETEARHLRHAPTVPISTLEGYYGSYAAAVEVAIKLYLHGTAARAQAGKRANKPRHFWTDAKCLRATEACREHLGHWPSEFEFAALRRAGTALCTANGWDGLVLPWPKVIQRLFGSYGEMLATAQRAAEARLQAVTNDITQGLIESAPRRPRRSRTRNVSKLLS
jgi:hypothetical protein